MRKALKFLDKPYLWVAYLIVGMYLLTACIATLRGLVKYNRVIDSIEAKKLTDESSINQILLQAGFKDDINQTPHLKDYIWAGLK